MDLFNSLPDELLCHVLSFLTTTKHAASTSVLSKRWRYLFAFVPNLDLDDSVFFHHPKKGKRERDNRNGESFIDFIDRVFALKGNSTIKNFSFKCKTDIDKDNECRLDPWICNVLQRGVLDIDISFGIHSTYLITSDLFKCRTLIRLRLEIPVVLNLRAGNISLPMLKTLVLDSVWFTSSSQLEMLVSACPALEELEMAKIHCLDDEGTVSSESLKTLTIDSPEFFDTFLFDTPNLICLKYSGLVSAKGHLVNLQNLVEAQIEIMLSNEYDFSLRLGNLKKIIRDIRNLQKLYLSHGTLEVLSLCCDAIPVFNNLKLLRIESIPDRGCQVMQVLLRVFRNCPHLQTLILEKLLRCMADKCGDACNCTPREEKEGHSLISCPVKKLVIREFRGTWREVCMIEHFLESFRCLKEMEIYYEPLLITPRVLEFMAKTQMQYNDLSSCNVKFKEHGFLSRKSTAQ